MRSRSGGGVVLSQQRRGCHWAFVRYPERQPRQKSPHTLILRPSTWDKYLGQHVARASTAVGRRWSAQAGSRSVAERRCEAAFPLSADSRRLPARSGRTVGGRVRRGRHRPHGCSASHCHAGNVAAGGAACRVQVAATTAAAAATRVAAAAGAAAAAAGTATAAAAASNYGSSMGCGFGDARSLAAIRYVR
eukprot:359779-Chlamydomonas_euryale.AAC.4